ncbi:hypothetical protein MNV49_006607 [Pseudohyphozyma bogoriensis]|nr:hypothetical protein MNV49_006607 [Pseudohyphozyma bogoriensis]
MSFANLLRRQAPQLARNVIRPAQTRKMTTSTMHPWFLPSTPVQKLRSIPTEAYPLIFFCVAMPSYGLMMGSKVFMSGKNTGELRLLPERYQAAPAKNVWDD